MLCVLLTPDNKNKDNGKKYLFTGKVIHILITKKQQNKEATMIALR